MEEQRFITRRPRHEVQPDARCLVRLYTNQGKYSEGHLVDLSRHGLKLVTDGEISLESPVRVQAELPTGPVQVSPAATIRWSRLEDDGRWAAGLVFDRELSWEVMGEMFLNGILSIQATAASERTQSV